MIINFDLPHKIGTVCRWPCAQCGEDALLHTPEQSSLTIGNERVPLQPLFIVREATREEWIRQSRGTVNPPPMGGYNYEVLTD